MDFNDWMVEQGLTNTEVGRRLGLDNSYISLLKRHKRTPSAVTIAHIVEITGGAVTFHDWAWALRSDNTFPDD